MNIRNRIRKLIWSWASKVFAQGTLANAPAEIVKNPRILVLILGGGAAVTLGEMDTKIYSYYYSRVHMAMPETINVMFDLLSSDNYDVLHLLCDLNANGHITNQQGERLEVDALLEACRETDVKLLFIASGNPSESYQKGFSGRSKHAMNLVLTLNRKGGNFTEFLNKLLARMARGETMPMAWAKIAPQAEGLWQKGLPACLFNAGRAGTRLVP